MRLALFQLLTQRRRGPACAAPRTMATAIAVNPLVIPPYDILSADAAPIGPSRAGNATPNSLNRATSCASAPDT
jgi:hypothetical protein